MRTWFTKYSSTIASVSPRSLARMSAAFSRAASSAARRECAPSAATLMVEAPREFFLRPARLAFFALSLATTSSRIGTHSRPQMSTDDDGTREERSRGRKIGRTERARGRACVPRRTRVRRARVVAFVVS